MNVTEYNEIYTVGDNINYWPEMFIPSDKCVDWCNMVQNRLMIKELAYICISNILACAGLYIIHRWGDRLIDDPVICRKLTWIGIWFLIVTNLVFALYVIYLSAL